MSTGVEAERILRSTGRPLWWQWRLTVVARAMLFEEPLDLGIALPDQCLALPVQDHCLAQSEHVLGPVVTGQSLGDRLLVVLAAHVPVFRQFVRVTVAGEDVLDDRHPRRAGDVRQHLRQLHVHQLQGLLHVLDVLPSLGHEAVALTHVGTQHACLVVRAESRRQ